MSHVLANIKELFGSVVDGAGDIQGKVVAVVARCSRPETCSWTSDELNGGLDNLDAVNTGEDVLADDTILVCLAQLLEELSHIEIILFTIETHGDGFGELVGAVREPGRGIAELL